MKTAPLAAILLASVLSLSTKGTAQPTQYVTLRSSNVGFQVQTNQIVSVVGYDWVNRPQLTGNLADGTLVFLTPFYFYTNYFFGSSSSQSAASVAAQTPQIFTSLTNITVGLSAAGYPAGVATFQITTPATANVISNYVPADAIVIPASATGNVQIILESSVDLVNWTAASPGTYGPSSATNRFFRVRAALN